MPPMFPLPPFLRRLLLTPNPKPLTPFRTLTAITITPTPTTNTSVALFWDLSTSKRPSALPPYDAAVRLHLAASSFGRLRLSAAYAHPCSLHRHLPPSPSPTHLCRVCGRRFRARDALLRHFDGVHSREHAKRLRRIESARDGAARARLAAGLSLKLAKYAKAARELAAVGSPASLADDLRRAGVRAEASGAPSAALREHAQEVLDEGTVRCLVVVSGDVGLAGVLGLAREKGVRSVVVGGEGGLARLADVGFSWAEVVAGKARDAAPLVRGKWRDKDVLKRLEWRYEEEGEEEDVVFGEDGGGGGGVLEELEGKGKGKPWWKLDSDTEDSNTKS